METARVGSFNLAYFRFFLFLKENNKLSNAPDQISVAFGVWLPFGSAPLMVLSRESFFHNCYFASFELVFFIPAPIRPIASWTSSQAQRCEFAQVCMLSVECSLHVFFFENSVDVFFCFVSGLTSFQRNEPGPGTARMKKGSSGSLDPASQTCWFLVGFRWRKGSKR